MKRFLGLCMTVCILLSGCSAVDSANYKALKEAVSLTAEQNGGQIQLQSSATGQDDMFLSFRYCFDDADVMHYCVEQTDKTGRRLFLEHHDGDILQRWLLGHGTSSYDETGSEFVRYTRQKPYKYLTLLSDLPQKEELLTLSCSTEDTDSIYTLEVDPSKADQNQNDQETLVSRTLTYRVNAKGMLSCYTQESVYENENGEQSSYTVTLEILELGDVFEITLPEIE